MGRAAPTPSKSTRWLVLGLVTSCSVLLFPASSPAAISRVRATAENTWNPSFQHVIKGDKVVWINPARHETLHDLTAYGKKWSKRALLEPGQRARKVFKRTGTYKYRCRVHSSRVMQDGRRVCEGMCGVIHVARS